MKPIDEEKHKIVAEWLHKAKEDFRSAEILMNSEEPALYNACFLAQQSVEKFLKAFLTKHQIEFRKTHDINESELFPLHK